MISRIFANSSGVIPCAAISSSEISGSVMPKPLRYIRGCLKLSTRQEQVLRKFILSENNFSFLVAYIAKIVGKVSPLDLKMEMQILPYLVAQLLGY